MTLISGELRGVVTALDLSRATMRNIRENLAFAFGYNALGIPIAAGVLYPFFELQLSPMTPPRRWRYYLVVTNSNRLRRWRPPTWPQGFLSPEPQATDSGSKTVNQLSYRPGA